MGSAKAKIGLWFFRDMSDEQRLKLFSLFEMPVDELQTHSAQRLALDHVLGVFKAQELPK